MKTKVSPAVIGMFVVGAMALGVFALIAIGDVNFFCRPQRFLVNFDETVHGLDAGSPVKLRGVRVGRVVSINLRYQPDSSESVVTVVCELSRDVLADKEGVPIDVSDRAELERLIARGLRAQLGVIGLATGLLYVELDFFDPKAYPAPPTSAVDLRYANVPAVPSTISEFQASLSEILTNLKGIDFAGNLIAIFTIVSVAASISAMVLSGPRVYFAMARDGAFLPSVARVHPTYRTPSRAIWAQAAWSGVLVLSSTLSGLVNYTGFAIVLFSGIAVAALFVLRFREPHAERPFKAWGYPFAPGLFVVASAAMIGHRLFTEPSETLYGLLIIAAGIPLYYLFARKK